MIPVLSYPMDFIPVWYQLRMGWYYEAEIDNFYKMASDTFLQRNYSLRSPTV